MPVATFHEQVMALFSGTAVPARDRGWIVCPHGASWPADNFVTQPAYFQAENFKQKTFANHQRRFPACNCVLE